LKISRTINTNSLESFQIKKLRTIFDSKPLFIALMFFFAVMFGLLCGMNAIIAIAFLVIPIVVLIIYNPVYAFYIFVASLPLYVIPVSPGAAVSGSIPRLAGILLFTVWAPYVFFTKKFRKIKWDEFLITMLIFFGWMLISAVWSIYMEKGYIILRATSQLILALFIAITLVNKPDKFSHMVFVVLLTCMLAGFRSFMISFQIEERAVGIEGFDQNEFAAMLLAPMMVSFSLFSYNKSLVKSSAHILVALGCFLGALATVSRGFVISVLAACIALVVLEPRRKKLVIFLIIAFMVSSPYYVQKYAERLGTERFEISSATELPSGRAGIWKLGFEVLKNHPIIGVGIGGFQLAYDYELERDPTRVYHGIYHRVAHNDYLLISTELGLVGLFMWIFFLRAVFRKGFRSLKIFEAVKNDYLAAVTRGVIAGLIGLLFASFFLGLYHSKYMWLLLMFYALLGNLAKDYRSRIKDEAIKALPEP
jgi:putative inorganic carbon (HCO3(-)) transporter